MPKLGAALTTACLLLLATAPQSTPTSLRALSEDADLEAQWQAHLASPVPEGVDAKAWYNPCDWPIFKKLPACQHAPKPEPVNFPPPPPALSPPPPSPTPVPSPPPPSPSPTPNPTPNPPPTPTLTPSPTEPSTSPPPPAQPATPPSPAPTPVSPTPPAPGNGTENTPPPSAGPPPPGTNPPPSPATNSPPPAPDSPAEGPDNTPSPVTPTPSTPNSPSQPGPADNGKQSPGSGNGGATNKNPAIRPIYLPSIPSGIYLPALISGGGQTSSKILSPGSAGSSAAANNGNTDTLLPGVKRQDLLSFLVSLQCLTNNFYSCAASGNGNSANPDGCQEAYVSSWLKAYATASAREEAGQSKLLKQAVQAAGGQVSCPTQSLGSAFAELVTKAFAGSSPLPLPFKPYSNDYAFLQSAFFLDHLAAATFLGAEAVSANQEDREILALIAAAKEQHVGIVRARVNDQLSTAMPDTGVTVEQFTTAITNFVNNLAGGPVIQPLYTNQGPQIANLDSQGMPPRALPDAIRKVATFGAASGSGGGFFP